jgi:tRNA U34 2-thiouridine synthase MnmA/TrmU
MKRTKGLLLFSGGLDSLLAAKILLKQNIDLKLITFESYFFKSDLAKKSAKQLSLELEVIDISKEHLEIVKKPKFGYGQGANPCIDCHLLMLKKAKEKMINEGFDFIATGEVLDERPKSQNFKALKLIENSAELTGLILRPLSAKLLPETIAEKKGLVKRELLEAIKGRLRKRQLELARKFNLKDFPMPAGGCILTDLNFSKRIKKLLSINSNFDSNDVELLKIGRHFWEKDGQIIVGRDEKENIKLESLKKENDILIKMKNYPGPTTLIRIHNQKTYQSNLELIINKAKQLTQFYSPKARNKNDIFFEVKK